MSQKKGSSSHIGESVWRNTKCFGFKWEWLAGPRTAPATAHNLHTVSGGKANLTTFDTRGGVDLSPHAEPKLAKSPEHTVSGGRANLTTLDTTWWG